MQRVCVLYKALAPAFKGFIKSSERLDLWFWVDVLSMSVRVCTRVCVCVWGRILMVKEMRNSRGRK